MRVLGIVPARGGSRRMPGKNLAEVGGRTLVRRALDAAVASGRLDPVVLSSDDTAILAEAAGMSAVRALPRPAELATDTALAIDVVRHVLAGLEGEGDRFDAVAIVQPTSPLTAPEDVAAAVDLLERTGAESAATVVRLDHAVHPFKLKRLEGDRLVPFLEDDAMRPEHELPELWVRNGAVYVTRRDVVERGLLITADCRAQVMPRERSVDVNEAIDLAFAEFLEQRAAATLNRLL
jgi:CMP-N,N'-diacetyllegionaminic acid synthase